MWKWIKGWALDSRSKTTPDIRVAPRSPSASGKHAALSRYLEQRYADVVVLTFGQIEDLLGCALPPLAHTRQAWWTMRAGGADTSPYSDAWTLAGRTARPNLQARHVVFERTIHQR